MSKLEKITEKAANTQFKNKNEATGLAELVVSGKETALHKQNVNVVDDAIQTLEKQFKVFDERFARMAKQEAEMSRRLKEFTSSLKNYSGQTVDAMARIDKVCAGNFENKLASLERFVAAAKVLDDMEKRGVLSKVAKALAV